MQMQKKCNKISLPGSVLTFQHSIGTGQMQNTESSKQLCLVQDSRRETFSIHLTSNTGLNSYVYRKDERKHFIDLSRDAILNGYRNKIPRDTDQEFHQQKSGG